MLATQNPTPGVPPRGSGWVHEVKWDGIRLMARTSGGVLRLTNRNGGDVTMVYPELHGLADALPPDAHIDAEVIALDADGRPRLQSLAHRMHVRDPYRISQLVHTHPATLMVFDLVSLGGRPLLDQPWSRRRDLLEASLEPGPSWQLSDVHDDGDLLADATRAAGLEGVMSKRRASTYQPGVRSPDWLKTPHRTEVVAVIGGWVPETEDQRRLGAVWLGHADDEATFAETGLLYPIARAGSGLSQAQRADLLAVLREIERPEPPFVTLPAHPEVRRTRWVEPLLCAQMRYLHTTEGGLMRQPVLRALRPDVLPQDAAEAPLLDLPN